LKRHWRFGKVVLLFGCICWVSGQRVPLINKKTFPQADFEATVRLSARGKNSPTSFNGEIESSDIGLRR
jgi:hypothetical protein